MGGPRAAHAWFDRVAGFSSLLPGAAPAAVALVGRHAVALVLAGVSSLSPDVARRRPLGGHSCCGMLRRRRKGETSAKSPPFAVGGGSRAGRNGS